MVPLPPVVGDPVEIAEVAADGGICLCQLTADVEWCRRTVRIGRRSRGRVRIAQRAGAGRRVKTGRKHAGVPRDIAPNVHQVVANVVRRHSRLSASSRWTPRFQLWIRVVSRS